VIGECITKPGNGHKISYEQYWERLLELCGCVPFTTLRASGQWEDALVEAHIDGEVVTGSIQVRIRPLGLRVRDKRTDALRHRHSYNRWVGGRLITRNRVIRR
jgi:hypothetical protein